MANGFVPLRHKITGLVDHYPPHFAAMDVFEPADPVDEACSTCYVELPEPEPDLVWELDTTPPAPDPTPEGDDD